MSNKSQNGSSDPIAMFILKTEKGKMVILFTDLYILIPYPQNSAKKHT